MPDGFRAELVCVGNLLESTELSSSTNLAIDYQPFTAANSACRFLSVAIQQDATALFSTDSAGGLKVSVLRIISIFECEAPQNWQSACNTD
jgi:hypothetical protein